MFHSMLYANENNTLFVEANSVDIISENCQTDNKNIAKPHSIYLFQGSNCGSSMHGTTCLNQQILSSL